jgi:hypothetical protein
MRQGLLTGPGGGQRKPEVIEERARQKRTKFVFTCQCGAELLQVLERAARASPATIKVLAYQAHRKHQRETGCELGIV